MPPKREDTIKAFSRYVNMSAPELEAWLNGPECATAGTGVGLDSGERILGILQRNPDKVPEQYEDEDVAHMRKVVAYCKRHLAQEDKLKASKTPEQLEHTKSTISLKNWGHDPMKTLEDYEGDDEEENDDEDDEEQEKEEENSEQVAGTKRKHDESKKDERDEENEKEEQEDKEVVKGKAEADDNMEERDEQELDDQEEANEVDEPAKKRTRKEGGHTMKTRSSTAKE